MRNSGHAGTVLQRDRSFLLHDRTDPSPKCAYLRWAAPHAKFRARAPCARTLQPAPLPFPRTRNVAVVAISAQISTANAIRGPSGVRRSPARRVPRQCHGLSSRRQMRPAACTMKHDCRLSVSTVRI
ncbi:hypothetical protein FA95DRAFT_1557749 [Auriscalpium vulgare]|uniref:Uncharacterized protein n=1 Tax=Auriscalpium vulgare TaxID=40419 RepID=A0ACB8RXC6_9AGAM|nr:hypothetical protein FA95DRAFT_1557749 [Auriscalpium vulgare]